MTTKPIIFLIIGVVLLGGLFLIFKSKVSNQNSPSSISLAKAFEIVVQNRKVVSGPETLNVYEGDNVTIKITVDEPEELHLHGYDKSIDLEKGVQNELTFTATLTGRFAYELEHSKTDIGNLEVLPKN